MRLFLWFSKSKKLVPVCQCANRRLIGQISLICSFNAVLIVAAAASRSRFVQMLLRQRIKNVNGTKSALRLRIMDPIFKTFSNYLRLICTHTVVFFLLFLGRAWCLKIIEKVSFNIASERTSPKMIHFSHFSEFLTNWSLQSNSVTRQVNLN